MKKNILLIALMAALILSSCTSCGGVTRRSATPPAADELPTGFELVRDAGNGYFLYTSPIRYFLVSKQRQGERNISIPDSFVDLVYLGKELQNESKNF